ncbi:hypothetical protein [Aestuariivirga sp.]|uniref:hypothetical protein n=1 Tax=Aestuariivirga sp. TaxID=2650926 RepID=UPI0039E66BB0
MSDTSATPAKKNPYRSAPVGPLKPWAWFNKPDTKFNQLGVYHGKIAYDPNVPADAEFLAFIKAESEAALAAHTEKMTPAQKKQWSLFTPVEPEYDAEGNETGRQLVEFKQNAKIVPKDPDAEPVDVKIEFYDGIGKEITGGLWLGEGSKVIIQYAPRAIAMAASKKAGVRLDFKRVQVVELVKPKTGGRKGMAPVAGGYVHGGKASDADVAGAADAAADGDY